ncbi:MAG: hypothetical protein KKH41_03745 [Candidatus Thermoplasmatota archaeon]|nr:hypothetical protein [Euryarchaeota archaeon]MBU4031604.1 hypothetical protein [Candidatus Thermoplasmatota archaeon]MBU4072389.1 hypothetical protein [Candidatus Thermoplasmatota archaeon]MBU4144924.1 hypothetical protein [Candidatus Thermoplasmatota archaeon]MBU4591679.1 hypothetical protein [Candidatus Thermoplasmatota archaeon]
MMPCDADELAGILREIVKDCVSGSGEVALMFSGGLDSAILAVLARKFCDLKLYTAGLEGSHDLEWGVECAAIMDLPCVPIVLEENDIIESLERVTDTHRMTNPKWMTTFVGFDLVLRNISENTVLCGQGADELFGGYKKYRTAEEPLALMKTELAELVENEFPMYRKVAGHYGKELLAPYLDSRIINFAEKVPVNQMLDETGNKLVLRKAAELLGVPGMMAQKPKKAMQYGSGISKSVKHYLKSSKFTLNDTINNNQ